MLTYKASVLFKSFWGVFKVLIKDRTVAGGKYLNIWTKQNDGTWRVKVDMGDLNAK